MTPDARWHSSRPGRRLLSPPAQARCLCPAHDESGPYGLWQQRREWDQRFVRRRRGNEDKAADATVNRKAPVDEGNSRGRNSGALGDLIEMSPVRLRHHFSVKGPADQGEGDIEQDAREQHGHQQEG